MTANDVLATGYRIGRQFVHLMVDDLTAEEFQYQPVAGANSAAWIVGHLAVTAYRAAKRLGATSLPELTDEFLGKFTSTKQVAGTQAGLGDKAELLKLLDESVEKVMQAVRKLPPEALTGPATMTNPFVTCAGDQFVLGAMHFTLHCGQLSTIRRSLGKPPAI